MRNIDHFVDDLWEYLQVGPKDTYDRISRGVREQIKQLDLTNNQRLDAFDAYQKAVMGEWTTPEEQAILRRAVRMITKRMP